MIELIAGGARSGKSSYALARAQASQKRLHFVATAQALDDEMRHRIAQHKSERDARWTLHEEPIKLASLLEQFSDQDCVLVDCLTLWLTNCLLHKNKSCWALEKEKFLAQIKSTSAQIMLVSNETGMGVIPMNKLSRQFVDESGWLHQQLAKQADRVTLVTFGLPQILKEQKT